MVGSEGQSACSRAYQYRFPLDVAAAHARVDEVVGALKHGMGRCLHDSTLRSKLQSNRLGPGVAPDQSKPDFNFGDGLI